MFTDSLFPSGWRPPEAEACCPQEPISADCVPAADTLAVKNSVLPTLPSFLLPTSFPVCHSCLSFCLVLFASLPALRLCPAFNLALVEVLCRALPILRSSNGMHSFPGYKDTSGPAPRCPLLVAANTGAISLSSETGAKQLWTL